MQGDRTPVLSGTEGAGDVRPSASLQPQELQSPQDDTSTLGVQTLDDSQAPLTSTNKEPEVLQTPHGNLEPQPQVEQLQLLEPTVYSEQTSQPASSDHQVSQIDGIHNTLQSTPANHQTGQLEMGMPIDPPAVGEHQRDQDAPANPTYQAQQTEDSEMIYTHESGGNDLLPKPESLLTNPRLSGPATDQIAQPDVDSNSPLSVESSQSNQTDSAEQFYQAHHGYQTTEMDTGIEEPESHHVGQNTENIALPDEPQQPQSHSLPEEPSTHSPDDVVLPDDGYYPTSLHVDSEVSDTDSALGSDVQSSTMSLRSSLYESIQENGRTYHKYKEGQYFLPNDDVEQDRLNLQHHLWTLTLDGRLHLAPVEEPQRVLDLGTGTGLWALEYAERHPSAMVIGTDLSAIQPEYVPPNCQFEIDDAEDDWTYNQTFDFIHGRMLFTCFQNPAEVFKRAYKATAPGGYFEMQDVLFKMASIDGSGDNTAIQRWNLKIHAAAKMIGRDWHCAANYAQWMRDAGFEGVVERQLKWPSNTWPKGKKQKLLGMWSMANSLDGLPAISMALMTRAYGLTREEVEVEMVAVRKDIKDKSLHGFIPVYVVYGRKPASATS